MRLFSLLLLSVLAACASIGRPFDITKADSLRPGISTEQDAEQLLGKPISVNTNAQNSHQLLTWQYAYGTGLGTSGGKKLSISFDSNGRMLQVIQRTEL